MVLRRTVFTHSVVEVCTHYNRYTHTYIHIYIYIHTYISIYNLGLIVALKQSCMHKLLKVTHPHTTHTITPTHTQQLPNVCINQVNKPMDINLFRALFRRRSLVAVAPRPLAGKFVTLFRATARGNFARRPLNRAFPRARCSLGEVTGQRTEASLIEKKQRKMHREKQ